ncbi:hypothetical protein [Sandaracinus amylolyticus]|uniref:hypothetical protein n=1 Tax=Sandaracinus amylolyticus TaxID=927083 RepID=UPI001F39CC5E|nr:hypothetical protein [Sandaracinus amylolyticus]UJR79910.1 Hypothetical protein I5071_19500 [Sandaracinus amylolyticus]
MTGPRAPRDLLASSPSETTPFLLELARAQASRRTPRDLLVQRERDGFVQPSALDMRLANRLDAIALDAAPDYEALLLSPVAPLGVCSVVAPTSQDRTISASRATEVVSDPTNVLALECARRLAKEPRADVRLCTVHQTLRAQPHPKLPGFSPHFRLFAMVEAGAARADDGFEVDAFERSVRTIDRLFDASSALGCAMPARRAIVRATPEREVMARRVIERLEGALPHVEIVREPLEHAYYDGLRVLFGARTATGATPPLADVGRFDWMAKLTSNRKMRFVATGLGIQLLPMLFGT